MYMLHRQWSRLIIAAAVCLICSWLVSAADETTLTKEQIKHFLLTAKIVGSKQSNKGITQPWRLTLSDGTLTHDASFQAIDEHKTNVTMASGRVEMNFVDSYKYNIAAYELAELLGLDDMLPVYVERSWQGNRRLAELVVAGKNGRRGADQAEHNASRSRRMGQSDVQGTGLRPVGLR